MRSGVTSSTGWPSWVGRNPALWCPEREVGKAPPLAPQLNHATAPRGKGSDQIAVEGSARTMTPPDARPDRERTARRSLKPSEVFEQQIHKIYTLLERFEAEVTWNDRIIDPDQPTRRRQIDITIKRDDHLTIIECRLRQSRQNVQWIEELIGRRQSLQANEVIAVSSSGFTSGAVAKANSHDIITASAVHTP